MNSIFGPTSADIELERIRNDETRTAFVCATLQGLAGNIGDKAKSDAVARFAWDIAVRLMEFRAQDHGPSVPERPQPVVTQSDEFNRAVQAKVDAMPNPNAFPATGTPPQMPDLVQKWGDGSTYTPKDGEHDDGPF